MKDCCCKYFLTLLSVSCLYKLNAQQPFSGLSLGVQGHYGSFLTIQPKAQYVRDSYSYFGEINVQKGDNQQLFRKKHSQPWGVGVFLGNTGSSQYIGLMTGAFAYTNLPLLTRRSFSSFVRLGSGLGWVQKPYNKNTNHKNVLIGSHLNGFLNLAWMNEVKLNSRLSLNTGISFSHLSNGGTTLPNLGLNIPALTLGFRWERSFENTKDLRIEPMPSRYKTSYTLYASAGWKQEPWIDSKRYMINALTADVNKRTSFRSGYGGGTILFYNRSMEVNPATITSDKREGNKVQAGLYIYYEHFMGDLSFPLHMGAYVYNQDIFPRLFQQLGIRYKASDRWSAQVLLKTHTGKADFIHAGLGYKIK